MPIGASRERSLTDTPLPPPPPSLQTVGWLKRGNNFSQAKIFYSRDIMSYFNSLQWENQICEMKPRRISFSLVCKTLVFTLQKKSTKATIKLVKHHFIVLQTPVCCFGWFFILENKPALHKLYNLHCSTHSPSPALILSS